MSAPALLAAIQAQTCRCHSASGDPDFPGGYRCVHMATEPGESSWNEPAALLAIAEGILQADAAGALAAARARLEDGRWWPLYDLAGRKFDGLPICWGLCALYGDVEIAGRRDEARGLWTHMAKLRGREQLPLF